nr:dienelactone hydrolase family protein [Tessaracoccus sp. OS52]
MFHHVQGLTDGVREFADKFRTAGHSVLTPDLFDGALPDSIEEGVAFAEALDEETAGQRVEAALADVREGAVFGGISWGAMHAQRLAQTLPGAKGALLYEACIPITGEWAFGPWPKTVPLQVHGMADDPFFAHEGDLDAALEIRDAVGSELVEVYTYPGDRHLFIDSSLPSHDPRATALVVERSLEFLERIH